MRRTCTINGTMRAFGLLLAALLLAASFGRVAGAPPEIIRGVNLGGWLVLEPWITPSLFKPFVNATDIAVDEWTFTQILGPEEASAQLQRHWDTWLDQADIILLAQAGITHVRIPVGYWMVSVEKNEPYVTGQWRYLKRALRWCQQAGLKVLIDLHGVPGSQNGFDNSGRRGDIQWPDAPGTNILRTLYILSSLTAMLQPLTQAAGGPVTAIELVNEPFATIPLETIQKFYQDAYSIVRGIAPNLDLVIHDAFRIGAWSGFMPPPAYENVYLDTHVYHVFDLGLLRMNETQHLDYSCTAIWGQQQRASQSLWLITGEWSLATTDCATWLNGFGRGSRWDGTFNGQSGFGTCTGDAGNTFADFSPEYRDFLRTFAETQMDTYENAGGINGGSAGWFFWNFKTEGSAQWNFLLGLQEGYIPNPVTARTHTCANRPSIDHQRDGHPSATDDNNSLRPLLTGDEMATA